MKEILAFITSFVKDAGYIGIFIMTFLESTFLPIPAELTMIPAGYLVDKGELNMFLVMISSVLGVLGGSWLSYFIAAKYGRNLIVKYGKYFFMNSRKLKKMDKYFEDHGTIAVFSGRLIPGLRHYISFPAGLVRMDLRLFFIYTGIGGGIWMFCLLMLGFFIGEKEELIKEYMAIIQIAFLIIIGLLCIAYFFRTYKINNNKLPTV